VTTAAVREPPRGLDALALAVVRTALVPVVLAGERLVPPPGGSSAAFPVVLAVFALWALALLGLHLGDRADALRLPKALAAAEPFGDLGAIIALGYTSGGPFSETAMAFFVLPLLAASRLRPQLTAAWAAASVIAYAALSLAHPALREPDAAARVASQVGYLAWTGAAATLLSHVLARRDGAIARLAEDRRELAEHALTAEQRERRRLAEVLHDESMQTLSLARQELLDYHRHGGEDAFQRADAAIRQTMAQLRGEIFELHPYVLDHAGLDAALHTMADRCAARMAARIQVAVDPAAAGHHDELVVTLAREFLSNAAKHSHAQHVALTVAAEAERIELDVRDDGSGFEADERAAALRHGHIGLASSEQRVRSAGGELVVDSAPGRGTTVRAILPT
jgi:two-component system NarL family sensor kinase